MVPCILHCLSSSPNKHWNHFVKIKPIYKRLPVSVPCHYEQLVTVSVRSDLVYSAPRGLTRSYQKSISLALVQRHSGQVQRHLLKENVNLKKNIKQDEKIFCIINVASYHTPISDLQRSSIRKIVKTNSPLIKHWNSSGFMILACIWIFSVIRIVNKNLSFS